MAVLELFAGSGAMGFEALSRGARSSGLDEDRLLRSPTRVRRSSSTNDLPTAIPPASSTPVPRAPLDILKRAAETFDRVVVGFAREPSHTQTMFSVEERVGFLEEALRQED